MDVVIPYIHGPHNGEELRYALRSIATNMVSTDGIRIYLLGDRPAWVRNVEHVELPPLKGNESRSRDALRKLLLAAELCPEGFIHMYDDTYYINPTTLAEVQQRHHMCDLAGRDIRTLYSHTGSEWQQGMHRALALLRARGLGQLNHETHTPRWFEPISVRDIMEEYGLMQQPAHFRTLYFNTVRPEAGSRLVRTTADPYKLHVPPNATVATIERAAKHSKVMNHRNGDYTSHVRQWLRERFSTPSRYEQ